MQRLDTKLHTAITEKCHGTLGRQITQKVEDLELVDVMMTGRQAAWMVYEYMKTNAKAGALFDLNDLMSIRLKGDRLEYYWASWESTLTGMKKKPDDDTVETLFLKQVKYSDSMKIELAHYERHPDGHPDHSYSFLTLAIQRIINKRRQDTNRKEIETLLSGGRPPALAADEKGKGKGKGKGKYKDKDTDADAAPAKGKGKSKGKGKGKSRGRSGSKGKGKGRSKSPKGKGKGGKRDRSNSPTGSKGDGLCY